jgi:hypothetical protein
MRKLTFGIALFMILPFFARPIYSMAQQAAGPRMVLKEKFFDHKNVEEGAVIEHTYKVVNEGDQPLLIKKVTPG